MRIFKLLLAFLLVLTSIKSIAQESTITYYKGQGIGKLNSKRGAAYAETTTINVDSTKTVEMVKLSNNNVVSRQHYKGKEPIGKWIQSNYAGQPIELNYDFPVYYSDSICKNDTAAFINFRQLKINALFNNDSLGYIAPKLTGYPSISVFVQRNITYPSGALNDEMSGTVRVMFIIGTDANIEAIAVSKGVNILLDKEAVRIVGAMRFSNAASIGGIKKKVCMILPIVFKIED